MKTRSILHRPLTGLFFLLLAASLTPAQAQIIRLRSGAFDPLSEASSDSQPAFAKKVSSNITSESGKEYHLMLVQWGEPLDNAKLKALTDAGARLILPIPDQAYLVAMPPQGDPFKAASRAGLAESQRPRWASEVQPEWKLDPEITQRIQAAGEDSLKKSSVKAIAPQRYRIQFANTGDIKAMREKIALQCNKVRLHSQWRQFETWSVEADLDALEALASENSVFWMEPEVEPELMGERGALSIAGQMTQDGACVVGAGGGYQDWLDAVGVSGEGVIVSIMDDGLSQGITTNQPGTAHPDLLGRIVGIDNATNDDTGDGGGGHGTLNTSIIMGRPLAGGGRTDGDGFLLGQGVAPDARVFATKIFDNAGRYSLGNRGLDDLVRAAYQAGARISSNSWGAKVNGRYTSDSQLFDRLTRDADSQTDGFQPMAFFFSAGNEGSGTQTMGSPASAKNVVSVGASENCDQGPKDGCGWGEFDSNDQRDIAGFSSRGPMSDGRMAPTVIAPGVHVYGAASDSENYDGTGVCGRVGVETGEDSGDRIYAPAFQSDYTWSTGTSHSTPLVAGAATLLYEKFLNTNGMPPSPALLKAALVASTIDTAGGNTNRPGGGVLGHIPNNDAGWGRVSLNDLLVNGVTWVTVDQTDILNAPGATYTMDVQVPDPERPLKVVLVWTDPFASASAAKILVNDLDLVVSDGVNEYIGNVLVDGESIVGGQADRLNNVECVFLTNPLPAEYTITVRAHALNSDALPGVGEALEQDFALFISNGADQTPVGSIKLDREVYRCDDQLIISVSDSDLVAQGQISVTVASALTGDLETVILDEQNAPSGIMRGMIDTDATDPAVSENGMLTVVDGDTITATYLDDTLGEDNQPLVATDQASFDCTLPQLTNNLLTGITAEAAALSIQADEPVQAFVTLGNSLQSLTREFKSSNRTEKHLIDIDALDACTLYFYTIRLVDAAGNAVVLDNGGDGFAFQTRERSFLFNDDLETNPEIGWTHFADVGDDDWRAVFTSYAQSPTQAWFSENVGVRKDASLLTPSQVIPADGFLMFQHTYEFEKAGISVGYDGSVIEISTDGGVTWADLGPQIIEGGYNSVVSGDYGNPLGGREAWCGGSLGSMSRVLVDLSPYAYQTARIRFRLACDSSIASMGWYIDDVSLFTVKECVGELASLHFDQEAFSCDMSQVGFTIADIGLSSTSGGVPSGFKIAVKNESSAALAVPVQLERIDEAGRWQGRLLLAVQPDGSVRVGSVLDLREGQTLQLIYEDKNVGDSQQTVLAEAILDCTAPDLVSVEPEVIGDDSVALRVESNEPCRVEIYFGPYAGELTSFAVRPELNEAVTFIGMFGLVPCTAYHYRVELIDLAGNRNVFVDGDRPYEVTTTRKVTNTDDLEPDPEDGWTHAAATGADDWEVVNTEIAHSGNNAWRSFNTPSLKDAWLIMPTLQVNASTQLVFYHTYDFEEGFDGGVLEISTDNAESWIDLGGKMIEGGYDNFVIPDDYNNPIAGRKCWTGGALGPMSRVKVNLGDYAGADRLVRFRIACDESQQGIGWYIDDIGIEQVEPCPDGALTRPELSGPAEADQAVPFNSEVALQWLGVSGALRYRVFVGAEPLTDTQLSLTSSVSATLPLDRVKSGRRFYWRVTAENDAGSATSEVRSFRIERVALTRIADHLVQKGTALTDDERRAVDYNDDGNVTIDDLISAVNEP